MILSPDGPQVHILKSALLQAEPVPESVALPAGIAGDYQYCHQVSNDPLRALVPSRIARRLGRLQLLALALAFELVGSRGEHWQVPPVRRGVYLGTGLGTLDQTVGFVANMIACDESLPMPAKFVNSVHNAAASQIGIQVKACGPNHSFCHDSLSFHQALHQAMVGLLSGDVDQALVLGADAAEPYFLAVGQQLGWWSADGQAGDVLPGEGAAGLLLSREPGQSPLGHVAGLTMDYCSDASGGMDWDSGAWLRRCGVVEPQWIASCRDCIQKADCRYDLPAALPWPVVDVLSGTGRFCTVGALGMVAMLQRMQAEDSSSCICVQWGPWGRGAAVGVLR